ETPCRRSLLDIEHNFHYTTNSRVRRLSPPTASKEKSLDYLFASLVVAGLGILNRLLLHNFEHLLDILLAHMQMQLFQIYHLDPFCMYQRAPGIAFKRWNGCGGLVFFQSCGIGRVSLSP